MLLSNIHPSWLEVIGDEFEKPYFLELTKFIENERADHAVFPPEEDVFNAFTFPFSDVRAVIVGQDPYHGYGQAHGLSFSVKSGKIPPSLRNIFKELTADEDVEFSSHGLNGDLTPWLQQGVLLINSVLTVSAGKANSHAGKGWELFTDAVIAALATYGDRVVFMLFGAYAQKKANGKGIDTEWHTVLKTVHPSPLSASKGWFGSKVFSKCNAALEVPINWEI